MDGIEKITARIQEDAQREAGKVRSESEEKAQAILADYRAQGERAGAEILARGRRQAQEREERLTSAAEMERRKLLLSSKQKVLQETFDLALDKLCSLPQEEYVALLTRLVLQAVTTGREQLIFSQKDRSSIGKQVVVAANEALTSQVAPRLPGELTESRAGAFLGKVVSSAAALITGTGLLTLSEETRPIRGGFILVDGDVEVNCAFETLIRLQRETLEREIAATLFEG